MSNTLLKRLTKALDDRYEVMDPLDEDWMEQLAAAALEHLAAELASLAGDGVPVADLARWFMQESQGAVPLYPPAWRPGPPPGGSGA
jgi:hypothetical protein